MGVNLLTLINNNYKILVYVQKIIQNSEKSSKT